MAVFRQGDTATIGIEVFQPMDDYKLKIGIYRSGGVSLYETIYPDDGKIIKIDDYHFALKLEHEDTMKLIGNLTLRATVFKPDLSIVNSGESVMELLWEKEPVNKGLV